MRTLEELAMQGSTQILDLLPKVILEEVEEAARARRFGRSLVQINEDLVRTKGRSIVIGRRRTVSAAAVPEGVSPAENTIGYTANTISPSKIGVCVKITQEGIDGANLDLIRDSITEAGIALADKEDNDIIDTLLGRGTITLALRGTIATGAVGCTMWTSGNNPLLSLHATSINLNGTFFPISVIDYYDGVVESTCYVAVSAPVGGTLGLDYDNTSMHYGDYSTLTKGTVIRSGSFGVLTYEDIVGGLGKIRANKWTPDFILVHPNQVNDILKSAAFRDASQYGSPEVLLRGEIGMISGCKILATTNMIDGNVLFIASKRAAWLAIKRPVDLKRWDNPTTDSIDLYFYMEYGVAVTDTTALCVSVNHEAGTGLSANA